MNDKTQAIVRAASVYIPADWRQAIAQGVTLPERTQGAALFADISGFTPLTEALALALGLRRGAEELPRHLNRVYDALIGQVDRYGGSVIGFAGDAITCWFATDTPLGSVETPTFRAAACALDMQQVMGQMAAIHIPDQEPVMLAVKVAVTSGPARRFVVGDPDIQLVDVLAGETLARVSDAEHMADRGDVVIDSQTVAELGERAQILEWRVDENTGERFAVLEGLLGQVTPAPWPQQGPGTLTEEHVRPWLLPPVHARLQAGGGEFLTELHPAVALFLRFEGIDYDADDEAKTKLGAYIRWVQRVLARYDGTLLQLTIGDKGSYLYAAFGAPIIHEDDSRRAAAAALALRIPPEDVDFILPPQIGLSQGVMRTGAYGGTTRRTYGVLGDEVNMSARLMQYAQAGEVIANQRVQRHVAEDFVWELLPPIEVKGKTDPLPVARLLGHRPAQTAGAGLLRAFTSPLVGRETELAGLQSVLQRALAGKGQIVRLVGATGIGKSHLAAEFATRAGRQGWGVHVGVCQSITRHLAYSAWRPVFCALLGLSGQAAAGEADSTQASHIATLEAALDQLNPEWRVRLPLLGDLLDLPIPDNPTTAAFDPRLRQQALHTLAVDLILACARNQPLILLLEDTHWMDEASLGLTLALSRVVAQAPVLLMLVQRPRLARGQSLLPDLNQLSGYNQLDLDELPLDDMTALVANRLQVSKDEVSTLAMSLIQTQAHGNPFFADEMVDALRETHNLVHRLPAEGDEGMWTLSEALVRALREANCLLRDPASGAWLLRPDAPLSAVSIDIPNSVHRTVLSRLDRLPEPHRLTLKVASVIGRIFELKVLAQAHPARPDHKALAAQFETFVRRNFVHSLLPAGGTYAFKHNASQEVVYDMMPWEQQQDLHRAVGMVLETHYPKGRGQAEAVDQLAYHFSRGGDKARDKAMVYLDRAAHKAQREHANETALNYYDQALALEERWGWHQGRAQVLHILGRREQEHDALRALEAMPDTSAYEVAYLWGQYHEAMSDYAQAQAAIEQALAVSRERTDRVDKANCLAQLGLIARRQGDYEGAKGWYEQPLALFQREATLSLKESLAFAQALNGLGIVHRQQGDYDEARTCYERALELNRRSGNRKGEADSLSGLGGTAYYQRKFTEELAYYGQALEIQRTIGDRAGEAICFISLAQVNVLVGRYDQAEKLFSSALAIEQAIGNRFDESNVWNGLGVLYMELGDLSRAQDCLQEGLRICQEIGDEAGEPYMLCNLGLVARDRGKLESAERILTKGLGLARAQDDKNLVSVFLSYLSTVNLLAENIDLATEHANVALTMRRELGLHLLAADDLATLAVAHLGTMDTAKALECAGQSLAILDECGAEGPEFPHRDYFFCYQVLKADGQAKAAQAALQSAYLLVKARAEKITDPALRQSFLERVPINRQIIQEIDA